MQYDQDTMKILELATASLVVDVRKKVARLFPEDMPAHARAVVLAGLAASIALDAWVLSDEPLPGYILGFGQLLENQAPDWKGTTGAPGKIDTPAAPASGAN